MPLYHMHASNTVTMSNEMIQTHWAVLIGVGMSVSTQADTSGNHGSVTRDRSLKGSVPDIEMMEAYFQSSPQVKISKLTATKSKEKDSTAPIEPPEVWPTRNNLIALLTSIIKESVSRRLEHVYIHFSGHGSRRKSDGSLALSLFHLPEKRHELLPTEILASALKAMSKQGVYVTLVLDCCHAGAVRRSSDEHDLQVRYIEYSPEDDFGDDADYRVLRDAIAEVETSRGLILSRKDILEPEGYLVITACGPSESAQEIQHDGQRNGALTYFLHSSLMLLQRLGESISFQTLYDRLHGMFHVNYPHQTPRHYGSLTKSFFQDLSSPLVHDLVTVVKVSRENRFILQAGMIHGVHLGDEYLAYPYHTSETKDPESVEDSIRFNVISLDNTHSTVTADDLTRVRSVKEILSWKARLIRSKSDQRTHIHLSTSLSHEERRSLQDISSSHPLMRTSTLESESGAAVFVADVNSDGLFEIHKRSSDCIPNLPKLSRKNEESLQVLSDALGHLAAYNFFESITNRHTESQFGESLQIECSIDMGPDGWYDIADGTNFTFSLHNRCKRPLFMAVFNLRSTWEITNLLAEAAQGSYCEIPDQEEKITFPLQPERSDVDDGSQNEDIIKIFVTDQAPSFPFLVLPALGKSRHRDHAGPGQLLDFVKRIEGGYRQGQNEGKKRWMTRNFYLRVS